MGHEHKNIMFSNIKATQFLEKLTLSLSGLL